MVVKEKSPKMTLEIYDSSIKIVENTNEGKKRKTISSNTLLELLSLSKNETKYKRIGSIPIGFVDGCIGNRSNTFKVLLQVKSDVFFTYYEKSRFQVPFPHMLFFFESNNGKVERTSNVYAIDTDNLKEDSRIYKYPYGNVSGYGGGICWGSNRLPKVESFKDFERLPLLFINSIMNSDHYNDVNKSKLPLRDLLVSLDGSKEFPNEILEPTTYTFKQIRSQLLTVK